MTNSLATALYIVLIVSGISNMKYLEVEEPNFIIPIFMLMLFVFSAALTGTLVFGKPVLLYLEGKKKEAISLLIYTLGTFFILMLLALAILIVFKN